MRKLLTVLKWVAGLGLVVALVCGGGLAFLWPVIDKYVKEQQEKAKGELVQVEPVARGELGRVVTAPGTVEPETDVEISARVVAKIKNLPFEEGDFVRAEDVVVELDDKELQAALAASNARREASEAELESSRAMLRSEEASLSGVEAVLRNATAEYERNQTLFDSGDVAEQLLDNARAEMDRARSDYNSLVASLESTRARVLSAEAQVKIAEAEVIRAQEDLDQTVIRSPINGAITQLNAEIGEVVVTGTMNNPGTVIMKIADLSTMLVKARLAEVDLPRVKEGQGASVYVNGYPDRAFRGTLRRVGLETRYSDEDNMRYFEGEIELQPVTDARLVVGLNCTVDIDVETIHDVVVVPSQAVMDKRTDELPAATRSGNPLVDPDKSYTSVVFVMEEGKAKMRPVKVRSSNLTRTAISDGLKEGETLIVGPFRVLAELADGKNVRLDSDSDPAKGAAPGAPAGETTTESSTTDAPAGGSA